MEEIFMTEIYGGREWIRGILNRRYVISFYAKRKSYYVSRCLRERLNGKIHLRLDPEKRYCLILEQEPGENVRTIYGCAGLWKEIEEAMQIRQNVRFLFFPVREGSRWIGYLLPDWENQVLWAGMDEADAIMKANYLHGEHEKEESIIRQIRNRYWNLVDFEEAGNFWQIGKIMAARMEDDPALGYVLAVFYANELIVKYVRCSRRAQAVEAGVSLDAPLKSGMSMRYGDIIGTDVEEVPNLIIEDFKEKLTALERYVLRKLEREDDVFSNCCFGIMTKKTFAQTVQRLRDKAMEYFGKSYIESFFVKM